MTNTTTGLLSVVLTSLALTAAAQDTKIKNDITYSSNNYKQANKAALARQWEHKSGALVLARNAHQVALDDYKQQSVGANHEGGITVLATSLAADQNYKMQHGQKSEVAKRHTTGTGTI